MVFKDILILNFILFFTKELKQNIFLYNKNYIFRKIIHSVFCISLTFMALIFPTGNSFAQNEHYDYKFKVGKPVDTKVILPGEHGSATWYPCNYKNDCDEIPGLKYRTNNSKLGYIEGTPTKAGDYLFPSSKIKYLVMNMHMLAFMLTQPMWSSRQRAFRRAGSVSPILQPRLQPQVAAELTRGLRTSCRPI